MKGNLLNILDRDDVDGIEKLQSTIWFYCLFHQLIHSNMNH